MCTLDSSLPLSTGISSSVCSIGSVWHLKRFFSKFLLDGVSEDVVGDSFWRKWSSVSDPACSYFFFCILFDPILSGRGRGRCMCMCMGGGV